MRRTGALSRLLVSITAGILAAAVLASVQPMLSAVLLGWSIGGLVYLAWTWVILRRLSPEDSREHARLEDPGRRSSDLVLTGASLASVAGVAMMIAGGTGHSSVVAAFIGLAAVAASWGVIQTVYTVRYAAAYYAAPVGGVDWNEGEAYLPDYRDFAYLAFTLGMTYQVSDTNLATRTVRRLVLQHALLSYLFGAVILAMTINLVVQLASN